jgi:hypothetical protein
VSPEARYDEFASWYDEWIAPLPFFLVTRWRR